MDAVAEGGSMKIRLETVHLDDDEVKNARRVHSYEKKHLGEADTFKAWCKSHLEVVGVMGFAEYVRNRLGEYELN
jgi:hypothetical protein